MGKTAWELAGARCLSELAADKNVRAPVMHGYVRAVEGCLICLAFALNSAQAEPLSFDHGSGFYESAFQLALSAPVKGAAIYYTTNGVTPWPATALRYQDALPISTTTIVRAAAFDHDKALTAIATRTYLFIPAILRQTAGQLPKSWGTNGSETVPAHYNMAAAVADDAQSRDKVVQGLGAIPSLSIVTDPENLFASDTGIYLHPLERGAGWERPASVELLDYRGQGGFRLDCGLRIHGGMSRHPEQSPKHSFRLSFKGRYGPAQLHFPLFGTEGPRDFDDLILRAGSNDSWLDSDGEHRCRASYIHDEWMRRSLGAMGYPSSRGTFVHLYLNGLYWGVYNLCERPGASLLANNETAPAAEYDARKGNRIESGDAVAWDKMMALVNSSLGDERSYQLITPYLDLPELADYLILNFYAGNADWDRSSNWYAARPRTPRGQFRFFVWDAERTLDDPEAATLEFDDDESPLRLFHKLSGNAAFRALFAERAQRLLFGNGPLAPEPAAERYRTLANSIGKALAAEAARWGTYRRDVHPYKTGPYERYTVEDHWQPEVDRTLTRYFPQRRPVLLNQFRERGLFPAINAPARN
jgi:hypothetical protein